MSKERALLRRVNVLLKCSNMEPMQRQTDLIVREIQELLAQPEQTEHIKKKKEPEIYFVKDEFSTLRPTFKNPKETPLWIDVLHGGG